MNEMRKDPNIEIYKNMSKEILYNLGYTYRTDNPLDYNEDVTEACSYSGYGLKIYSFDLPGYSYEDENTGGLRSFIKDYMYKYSIYYNDKLVFNSEKNIYIKGIWEEILKELYNKLPILKEKKDIEFNNKKHCIELINNVINPLYYKKITFINDSLSIKYYSEQSYRVNNCGTYEDDYHYEVIKNSQVVMHIVDNGFKEYTLFKYTPGDWEDELKNCLIEYNNREDQESRNRGLEYIKQLKKL